MERRVYLIAFGFVSVASGLFAILTLGSVFPNWEFRFAAWNELRKLRANQQTL